MLAEDAAKYAYFRVDSTEPADADLLGRIAGSGGGITMRELVAATGMEKERCKEAIMRLDRSLKVIRAFGEREDWGTENYYTVYDPELPEENPCDEIVEKAIRAFGPVPAMAVRYLVSIPDEEIAPSLRRVGAVQILVGPGQTPMYIMPDELPALNERAEVPQDVRVLSLFDPDLGSKWAEISSRYGDRWVYPVTKGSRVIGAMEIWEMSGCVEVRAVDLDSPEFLTDTLSALNKFMGFYHQKGIEIVRIREVMGVDATELDGTFSDVLTEFGYVLVNGFYAKGRFITRVMTRDDMLSYVFRKQRLEKISRFRTFDELIQARGYVRSDQELPCRVATRTSLKKQMELGTVVKSILCPTYVGYIDPARLPVLRAAKKVPLTGEQVALLKIITARQPIKKKDVTFHSPYSYKVTADTLSDLTRLSAIYIDGDSSYCATEPIDMSVYEATKQIARWHFTDFGIFSAESVAQFLNCRMGTARKILADLEEEGFLVKGFLLEGESTLYWMLAEDQDARIRPFTGMFLLNTQDNLSLYLRDMIKRECGSTVSVIFSGTKIIGWFKGKVTPTAAKVDSFEGSDLAKKYLEDLSRTLGVSLRKGGDPDDEDWEASEFYSRTNPGL